MGVDDFSKSEMIALGFVFLIIPCIFVALRIWAKWISRHKLQVDDYLIFVGLMFSIACSITQLIGAIDGELGQHQPTGPDGQPDLNDPRFLIYEKCKFASQIMAVIGIGSTKLSLLVLFRQIFSISRGFRTVNTIMIAVTIGWMISFFFANLFTCYPVTPLVESFYGNKCINSTAMWYSSCVTDVAIDLVILVMPLPPISKLQLPRQQKLVVSSMFIVGAAVIAVSVTRLGMYIHIGTTFLEHYNDETYYTSPVFFWTNIEISLAVMLACLPTLRPIWNLLRGQHLGSTVRSYEPYYSSRSGEVSGSSTRRRKDTFNDLDTINLVNSPHQSADMA
ncbi:hypothetical protein N7456_000400 [Penicillium angulare]|uniref:Rhodopsin domain-containing protein n=1 Tax=Penicillium angulare TaxID=116970 RepID=A0A9W9GC18_9EURO|nr:hypothetical protein N7456_000400 [Penicillium angulare]